MENYEVFQPEKPVKPLSVPIQMTEALVAKFWDFTPWGFRELTAEQQAELMAVYIVDRQISNYYSSEEMKRMEKDRAKDKGSGMSVTGKAR